MIMTLTTIGVMLSVLLAVSIVNAAENFRLDGGESVGWDESSWRVQVDGVMGGRSSGELEFDDNSATMTFSGDISLVGGGFASVRRNLPEMDLSSYAGIVVEIEADELDVNSPQPPLGIHLQLHDSSSYWGFAAAFSVPIASDSDHSASVFLPMESFDRGSRSGYQCNTCSLDLTRINGMDVYVLFQDGGFEVNLKSITAVTDVRDFPTPSIAFESVDVVKSLLEKSVDSGSFLYNQGYRELCISVYWSVLNTVVSASQGVSDAVKTIACAGIFQSTTETKKNTIAWTLRSTIDAILVDMQGVDNDRDDENNQEWLSAAQKAVDSAGGQCTGMTTMTSGVLSDGDQIKNTLSDVNEDDIDGNVLVFQTSSSTDHAVLISKKICIVLCVLNFVAMM